MRRMVILIDSFFTHDVRAHLVNLRIQYSLTTDLVLRETRISVPYAKGVHLTTELGRASIPYEII